MSDTTQKRRNLSGEWIRNSTLRRVLTLVAGVGLSLFLSGLASGPALAGPLPVQPKIATTQATFKVPAPSTLTWTLRLWSHGTLEGSDTGTSGMLTVAVPHTSDCAFQADVSTTAPGGRPFFYSGRRATMADCGVTPTQTLAGHIYLCTPAGAPTTTELPGGTLTATGPQSLSTQANPLDPTSVASGSYTMTAATPTGYLLVVCGGTATVASGGLTASQSVPVASGSTAVGFFYASTPPAGGGGGGSSGGGGGGAGGGGSSGTPGTSPAGVTSSAGSASGSTSPLQAATAAGHSATVQDVTAAGSSLAFTGMDAEPPLLIGLILLALGTVLMAWSRRRSDERQPVRVRN
jgi:hypothetical protein